MRCQDLGSALLTADAVPGDLVRTCVVEHRYVVELTVAAQVIDVGVRVDDENRQIGQCINHAPQITDITARIDERGPLITESRLEVASSKCPGSWITNRLGVSS